MARYAHALDLVVRAYCSGILGGFLGGNLLSMIRDNVNVYWES